MLRRTIALIALALATAVAVPGAALAFEVQVRVEGVTRTLFGATEPRVTPYIGALPVAGGGSVDLTGPTALGTLESASLAGEFFYLLTSTSVGPYVSQIGRTPASDTSGWAYKVNGVSPPVGANAYVVKAGDEILWYYATFTEAGGPPTLDLVRARGGCYRAVSVDDTGGRSTARGVTFRLDGRAIRSPSGRICPSGDWHQLRAIKDGSVRSQLVVRR